jgi:hypothetical protein
LRLAKYSDFGHGHSMLRPYSLNTSHVAIICETQ